MNFFTHFSHTRRAVQGARILVLLVLLALVRLPLFAQPGALDPSFVQTGTGLNNQCYSPMIQPDGKIIVCGDFTSYDGNTRKYIARINADGTLDNTFTQTGSGLENAPRAIALQTDGKIVVVGDFTDYNGTPRTKITRLNADGSLDATFVVGTGFGGSGFPIPYSLTIQPDGRILVGGFFDSYNGTSRIRLVRINSDGSVDTGFNTTGTGLDDITYSIRIQSDNKILVAGAFTQYDGVPRSRIARLNADGTLDATFTQTGTGFNNQISRIELQSDGKILVGGLFTSYNGTPTSNFARLNTDGSLDPTFVQTGTGFNGQVGGIGLQTNGQIIVNGGFTSYNGIPRKHVARLNPNGSLDPFFIEEGSGLDYPAYNLRIQSDGKVIVAGNFTQYNGAPRFRIARLGKTPLPVPAITSFLPASAYPMQAVTITGTNFYSVTQVQFNGMNAAWFEAVSPTQIRAVVPTGAGTGTITATNSAGTGTSPSSLTVTAVPAVSTLAGDGVAGNVDAVGGGTRMNDVRGMVKVGGDVYFIDLNQTIRKLNLTTKVVTTFAGSGAIGFANGTGTAASFYNPAALATDGTNLYVSDENNNAIRKIVIGTGVVTTLVGTATAGFMDNLAGPAGVLFSSPCGLVCDGTYLYCADLNNRRIRRITLATGATETFAGSGMMNNADGIGTAAGFNRPFGLTIDGAYLYIAGFDAHNIRRIDIASKTVTTIAGSGSAGFADGVGAAAQFNRPIGVSSDGAGTLYVSDYFNHRIRTISLATNTVSTLAGDATAGFVDGAIAAGRFNLPSALLWDGTNVIVSDGGNNSIRRIVLPPPSITSFAPASAYPMQVVTITGLGFIGITQVQFNGMNAAWFSVDSPTQIRAVVPIGAVTGTITATNSAGTGTSGSSLTITVAPQVSTFVGSGTSGFVDAAGAAAQFNEPRKSVIDGAGNLFIADGNNHCIRRITPGGVVTTFAGNGTAGFVNGTGTAARFSFPASIERDAAGNFYISDQGNHAIRMITPGGVVTTLAGTGSAGYLDGAGASAQFNVPDGAVLNPAQTILYVADALNRRVRAIALPGGTVSTFAGSGAIGNLDGIGTAAQLQPEEIAVDASGNLYVADPSNSRIRKITPAGVVTTFAGSTPGFTNGQGTAAQFSAPYHLIVAPNGSVYVCDAGANHAIRAISPSGMVSTLAGTGVSGNADGAYLSATFAGPNGLSIDAVGNLYVGTTTGHNVRKISQSLPTITSFAPASAYPLQVVTITGTNFFGVTQVRFNGMNAAWFEVLSHTQIRAVVPTGAGTGTITATNSAGTGTSGSALTVTVAPQVSTLAGDGVAGSVDAVGGAARLNQPQYGVKVGSDLYFSDTQGHQVRRVNIVSGVVTTIAGSGTFGSLDGTGLAAQFRFPRGIVSDGTNLFVAESHAIRKIVIATGVVTTFAGSGTAGFADGTGVAAQFNNPGSLVMDGAGNIYVADEGNHRIRAITSGGVVSTIAGSGTAGNTDGTGAAAQFNSPVALALRGSDTLYVATVNGHRIRTIKISTQVVTTLAGSTAGLTDGIGAAAQFNAPRGLAYDGLGTLYVAEQFNTRIRSISTFNGATSTVTGTVAAGHVDGTLAVAQFRQLTGLVWDAGNLYVFDEQNHRIRKIAPAVPTITSFLPASAYPMQVVTITGTNLTGASQVQFNGVNAAWFSVDSPTQLRAVVPTGAGTGTISVTTFGGTATSGSSLTITPAPQVSTFIGDGVAGSVNAVGGAAQMNRPLQMCKVGGDLYVVEVNGNVVRKVNIATGTVTTFAGSGVAGFANGTGTAAQFTQPIGIVSDGTNLFVAEKGNHVIRKIVIATGVVTTFAGSVGSPGFANGTGLAAQFNIPCGLAIDGSGTMYLADAMNHRIRVITPGGVVTTLAGSGTAGNADGTGAAAQFNRPLSVALGEADNLYVSTEVGHHIRRIIISTQVVTTLAGSGVAGFADGTGAAAQFNTTDGLAFDGTGTLYVADLQNNRIRSIVTSNGATSTLTGLAAAGFADGTFALGQFNTPSGVFVDAGTLYVSDYVNHRIRKVNLSGSTYFWNGGAGADWQVAGSWSPPRTSPVPSDILQFNAGTHTPTNVPSQSIKQLIINGNVTLAAAAAQTLSVGVNGVQIAAGVVLDLGANVALGQAAGGTITVDGTLNTSTSYVNGAGNLVFGANSILGTANNDGVNGVSAGTGAVRMTGTITYNASTSYDFTATNTANRLMGFAAVAGKPVIAQCKDVTIASSTFARTMDNTFTASGAILVNGRLQTAAQTLSLNGTGTLTVPSGGRMIASANGTISNGNASPTSFSVQSMGTLEIQDNGQVSAASASDVNYIAGSTLEYSGSTAKTTTAREIGASGVQNMIVSNSQPVTLGANAIVQQSLAINAASQLVLSNVGNPTLMLNGTLNQNGAANIASVNGANAGSITLAGTGALAL
ncbi:MAG: hypothetical protein EAZ92_02995, partial [Candidatus Kapaibacterium sp.]